MVKILVVTIDVSVGASILGIQSASEDGFMDPKYDLRFGGDEGYPLLIIIWEYDWILIGMVIYFGFNGWFTMV